MKNHTKVYMKYFNFKIPQDCFCEICGAYAQDIHHIEARGMGGSSSKDAIENLMALCREHHLEYGDVPDKKEMLNQIHNNFMKRR
jgi:hypothetical protein